jgi:pimeloyl-ACP methyl ester carboxylesterase
MAGAALIALGLWAWTPDKSRATLEAQYLAAPDDLINVLGTTLQVRDSGAVESGKTVILLHGLGAHLQTWDDWALALAPHVRVLRLDLPGAGLSWPDSQDDYSDERSIALIVALMDQLGIGRASLIGNSIGGRIAWRFAAAHGERIDKLVLVSPDGYASPGFEYGSAPKVPFVMNAMRYALPKSMLRPNLEVAYSDPTRLEEATMDRYYDLMLAPGNRQALLDRMRQTVLVPPDPVLIRIDAPVLLLWGADDRMIPVSNAQNYLRVLPDARLVTLPDLGHLPMEEDGAASVSPVLDFLQQ